MEERISLVMSCYNGSKYITEQLESLKNQTRQIDEVLIFDDGSTDDTVAQVEKYISDNCLRNWQVQFNAGNYGWQKSFAQGILKATGDILFLCDQDDIWMPDKIETMARIMENKAIGLLVSDLEPLYMSKDARKLTLRSLGSEYCGKIPCSQKNYRICRPGCTFAVRTEMAHKCISKYWKEQVPHDALLWEYALITGQLWFLNQKTIHFRRHGGNSSNNMPHTVKGRLAVISDEYTRVTISLRIAEEEEIQANEAVRKVLLKQKAFSENRRRFFEKPSLFRWLKMAKYFDCYAIPRAFFADLVIALRK